MVVRHLFGGVALCAVVLTAGCCHSLFHRPAPAGVVGAPPPCCPPATPPPGEPGPAVAVPPVQPYTPPPAGIGFGR